MLPMPPIGFIDSPFEEVSKNLVVKDNRLINACYNLSFPELRIINLAIAKKGVFDNEHGFMAISAEDYSKAFNVHKNTAYEALEEVVVSLFEKQFSYKIGQVEYTSRWIQSIGRNTDNGKIHLKFSDDVLKLINNLSSNFTKYQFKRISNLNSGYAIRLYEIVSKWRSIKKTPLISIDDLKYYFGITSEYSRLEAFKRRILEPALKEINEKTDLTISYEQKKKGRVVAGFVFFIDIKIETQERDPNTVDWIEQEQKPKREKLTINEIVCRHPNETIGKSEPEIYKMFGSKYHII